jgi:hypothetical protein
MTRHPRPFDAKQSFNFGGVGMADAAGLDLNSYLARTRLEKRLGASENCPGFETSIARLVAVMFSPSSSLMNAALGREFFKVMMVTNPNSAARSPVSSDSQGDG